MVGAPRCARRQREEDSAAPSSAQIGPAAMSSLENLAAQCSCGRTLACSPLKPPVGGIAYSGSRRLRCKHRARAQLRHSGQSRQQSSSRAEAACDSRGWLQIDRCKRSTTGQVCMAPKASPGSRGHQTDARARRRWPDRCSVGRWQSVCLVALRARELPTGTEGDESQMCPTSGAVCLLPHSAHRDHV